MNTLRTTLALCLVPWVWYPALGFAQSVRPISQDSGLTAYTHAGVDYAPLTTTLGLGLSLGDFECFAQGKAGLRDLGDFSLAGGSRWTPFSGVWRVPVEAFASTRRADNLVMTAWGLGLRGTLTPGYYGRGWTLGLEGSLDAMVLTHITHSTRYRQQVFEGARDGWYSTMATTWGMGGRVGWHPGRWALVARAGWRWSGEYGGFLPGVFGQVGTEVEF